MTEFQEMQQYLRSLADEDVQELHEAQPGALTFYEGSIPRELVDAELRRRGLLR